MKQALIDKFADTISDNLVLPDILTLVEIIEEAPNVQVNALEKIATGRMV